MVLVFRLLLSLWSIKLSLLCFYLNSGCLSTAGENQLVGMVPLPIIINPNHVFNIAPQSYSCNERSHLCCNPAVFCCNLNIVSLFSTPLWLLYKLSSSKEPFPVSKSTPLRSGGSHDLYEALFAKALNFCFWIRDLSHKALEKWFSTLLWAQHTLLKK